MGHRPVTDADRNQVVQLHAQGHSRNEIARSIGRSGRTVSRIADALGLTFERGEQVQAATQAKVIDAKAKRAQLALDLLDDAARLREQIWLPAKVFNFGGRDNDYNEVTHDEPPAVDKLKLIQAAATAASQSLKLDEYDRQTGADEERSMLVDLAEKLGAAWRGAKAEQQ